MERIESDTDLLDMKEMDGMNRTVLDFYGIMTSSALFARPEMRLFLICRKVQFTMNTSTLSEGSVIGFIELASVLCREDKGIEGALRLGKLAMSCFKKRYYGSTFVMARLYCIYYSFIAFHTEPLQSCADMFRLGFDIGMSTGETVGAFFNSFSHINTALAAGERLPTLLDKVDYYIRLAEAYQNKFATIMLSITRYTISTLIGNTGSSTPTSNTDAPAGTPDFIIKASIISSAITAFWQGYSDRCHFYIEKLRKLTSAEYNVASVDEYLVMLVINGLNSIRVLTTRSINSYKIKSVSKKAVDVLMNATTRSGWNFRNKVRRNHQ